MQKMFSNELRETKHFLEKFELLIGEKLKDLYQMKQYFWTNILRHLCMKQVTVSETGHFYIQI